VHFKGFYLLAYLFTYGKCLTDDDIYYRIKRALHLHLVAMNTGDNRNAVSGVTQCFTYFRRLLPSTLTDTFGENVTLEQTRKRPRLSATDPSTTDNLSANQDQVWVTYKCNCNSVVICINSSGCSGWVSDSWSKGFLGCYQVNYVNSAFHPSGV